MPAMTQLTDRKFGSSATYGKILINWLIKLATMAPAVDEGLSDGPAFRRRREGPKRVMDMLGAALLLAILAPAIALLTAAVWISGGRPFYGHRRVGRHGKTFRCWKLRTMVPDAERRLDEILRADSEAAAEWDRDHKLSRDPRVTWVGRLLRPTSLDELPQLWNVLVGEMSLVGPRPVTLGEIKKYGATARYYLAVRPGLTGMWQVDGRNDIPFARRVVIDRFYVMRRSISGDVALLCRTPVAIIRRTGR